VKAAVRLAYAHWGGASLLLLAGCQNDVSVQLLPEPPVEVVCVDGDPCSGLSRALRFKGAYDHVEIPHSPLLDVPQDFTIEAWVLIKSYEGGHGVLNRWTAGVGDIQLTFGVPEPLPQLELATTEHVPSHVLASWGFVRENYWISVVAPTLPSTDVWHHIAASYGGGSYRLYVDGVLAKSLDAVEPIANAPNSLFIGATARNERGYDASMGQLWWPPMDGFISDVRISSFNRYASDFIPDLRLNADPSTIGLWHLDEGEGTQVVDSGPNQLSGSIGGAQWELAPMRVPPPAL
jgi:hypothetical protein